MSKPEISAGVQRSFGRDVTRLASGTVLAQVIGALLTPVLSRLFPPAAYGILAIFVSITSMAGIIACLRYELAVMLPDKDEEAANIFSLSLAMSVLVGTASMPLLVFGREAIPRWLNAPELKSYLWIIPFMIFINGALLALTAWNTRMRRYGRLSVNRVLNTLATQLPKLAFGFSGYSTGGVMIGATAGGQGVATAVLGEQVWRENKTLFRRAVSLQGMWSGVKRYRKFALVDIWGALLNNISWQLPPLLLASFFSQSVAGYYALSFRLLQMPMSLIGVSIGQVFYRQASEVRADRARLSESTERVFKALLSLSLFPVLLLTVAGREFFVVVFGPQWAEAGVYVQILSPWICCWFISSPLSNLFSVLERQGLALIVHSTIFLTRIASLLIGGYFGSVYIGLGLFSGSGVLVYGLLAFWNLSLAGVSWKTGTMHVLRYLAFALPGPLLLVALKLFGFGPLAMTGVAGVELALYYLIMVRVDPMLQRQFRQLVDSLAPRRVEQAPSSQGV